MSKLLFNRPPLIIDPELACLVGGWEAMILQQIHYWLEINQESNRNYRDGYFWTFNTYQNWQRQFPFLSVKRIKKAILSLEAQGLLIADNFNSLKVDRTKWYRINYPALNSLKLVSGKRKLQDWVQQAKRLGLDPSDIKLYVNEKHQPDFRPEPQTA